MGCAVALGILIALLAMGIFGDYPEGTSRAGIIVLFCLSLACLAWLFYLLVSTERFCINGMESVLDYLAKLIVPCRFRNPKSCAVNS